MRIIGEREKYLNNASYSTLESLEKYGENTYYGSQRDDEEGSTVEKQMIQRMTQSYGTKGLKLGSGAF